MKRGFWVISTALVGCASLHPVMGSEKTLVLQPRFSQTVQAILNPNTLASIATLDIVPYVENAPNEFLPLSAVTGNPTEVGAADILKLSQASPSIDPNRPFILRKLKPNKKYRIFGKAYNAANVQISQDSNSSVDVSVGSNDAPEMATLPIVLVDTPFAATTSVTLNTEGRFDYLKATLYLVSNNATVALAQTVRTKPVIDFSGLQGNTSYRLVAEAYKLGTVMASNSLTLTMTNDTAPAPLSLALSVPYVLSSIGGNGDATFSEGVGTNAKFNGPSGVVVDPNGNVVVADRFNHRIRKIAPDGTSTTFAGSDVAGSLDGIGTAATFIEPIGLSIDLQGNLYVADYATQRIRKVSPSGNVTTLAGNGTAGGSDGNGTAATFNGPIATAVDTAGNVYVAEYNGHRIRKIAPGGVVTTLAGNGTAGFADGVGTSIILNGPYGVGVDADGNLFFADRVNERIRKIAPNGTSSTFAGNGTIGMVDGTGTLAQFYHPAALTMDVQGNLYVADRWNHAIRKITKDGLVTTLAGNGTAGMANGTGTQALLWYPASVAIDSQGYLYIGDEGNQRVRKMQ